MLVVLLMLIYILLFTVTGMAQEIEQVLVFHSDHPEFSWTAAVNQGINDSLKNGDYNYKIFYEYLDLTNFQTELYRQRLFFLLTEKYTNREIDQVFVVDNAALDFYLQYGKFLLPDVPVVFTGVIGTSSVREKLQNLILEDEYPYRFVGADLDLVANIDLINTLHPTANELVIYGYENQLYNLIHANIERISFAYQAKDKLEFSYKKGLSFQQILADAASLDSSKVIFLANNFHDQDGSFIPPSQALPQLAEATDNPIYGTWKYFLGHGVVGGRLIDGYQQGYRAGELALKFIHDERIPRVPILFPVKNKYYFDHQIIEKQGIKLAQLPEQAEIINRPLNFIERNREAVYGGSAIIAILILIILFQVFSNYKLKKMQEYIRNQNNQLEAYNEEIKAANEEVLYLSYHDRLTGLYNRSYLDDEINKLENNNQVPVSILMGDLNKLKLVNDAFGHREGDKILLKAAEIIKSVCREGDVAGRWGGDEFLIILPDTDRQQAKELLQNIKELCKKTWDNLIPVSISLGLAVKEETAEDLEEIIKNADDEMYEDKRELSKKIGRHIIDNLRNQSSQSDKKRQEQLKLAKEFAKGFELDPSVEDKLEKLVVFHDIGSAAANFRENSSAPEIVSEKDFLENGYRIARSTGEFSSIAEEILYHKENWDGTGPHGLAGREIPLADRLFSIIDAYYDLTALNGANLSQQEAIDWLMREAGFKYDPTMVDIFVEQLTG